MTKVPAKFLVVACALHKLSPYNARLILKTQREDARFPGPARRVGEIAIDSGYLTRTECEEIDRARLKALHDGDAFDDIAGRVGTVHMKVSSPQAVALACLGLVAALLFFVKPEIDRLAVIVTLVSFVGGVLIKLLPSQLQLKVDGSRTLKSTLIWGTLVSSCLTAALLMSLLYAGRRGDLTIMLQLIPIAVALGLLLVFQAAAIVVYVSYHYRMAEYVHWRDMKLDALANRVLMLSRLAGFEAYERCRAEIIETVAQILIANPWLNAPSRFSLGMRARASVCLCYFKPDQNQRRFDLTDYSIPSAPDGVSEEMDRCQREHHPAFYDQEACERLRARCTGRKGFDRQRFLAHPDRNRVISLAGVISKTLQAKHRDDVYGCPAFDDSYFGHFSREELSRKVRAWLDFRAVAGYPILSSAQDAPPADVLMALTNVKNGFTEVDRLTMRVATKLLSFVRGHSMQYDSFVG